MNSCAQLTDKEARVFTYITTSPTPVTLEQIASGCFAELPADKANSWVRNQLRRLRDGLNLVAKVGRGTYAPVIPATVDQPQKKKMAPARLSQAQAQALDPHEVRKVKNLDCSYYNDCLTMARDGDWAGFGCHECTAYEEPDVDQKVSDVLQLQALRMASENAETDGCAGRKRGVKPGADAKVGRKLYLVPADKIVRKDEAA